MLKTSAFALALALPAAANAAEQALPTALDAGWKGQKVCELLFENATVRTARCTFPPGVGHERHFHPAHWGYILESATMRITTADGTVDRDLKAGNSWWSDGIAWHEAVNIGTTTGVYLIVEPKR
jgi:quercetin dioxygenase-like cupin family protein